MVEKSEIEYIREMLKLVGKYATPLAFLLILPGFVFSKPAGFLFETSIFLWVFGMVFNFLFIRMVKEDGSQTKKWMAILRLGLNLAINTALVSFLGENWQPMWLLFSLTPVATAIYGTKSQTLFMSVCVVVILLGIQTIRPDHSVAAYGQQVVYGSYILLVSLLINDIVGVFVRDTKAKR